MGSLAKSDDIFSELLSDFDFEAPITEFFGNSKEEPETKNSLTTVETSKFNHNSEKSPSLLNLSQQSHCNNFKQSSDPDCNVSSDSASRKHCFDSKDSQVHENEKRDDNGDNSIPDSLEFEDELNSSSFTEKKEPDSKNSDTSATFENLDQKLEESLSSLNPVKQSNHRVKVFEDSSNHNQSKKRQQWVIDANTINFKKIKKCNDKKNNKSISDDDTSQSNSSPSFTESSHNDEQIISRSFEKESLKQLKFMKKDSAQPGTSKYVLDIDDSDNNDSDSTEHLETQIPDGWWSKLPNKNHFPIHPQKGQNFTKEEQKLMITYLVQRNFIGQTNSRLPWRRMHEEGYLKHRSVESISNHMRKVILNKKNPKIYGFKLPKCLEKKFLNNLEN